MRRYGRRRFTQGLGVGALCAPFVSLLEPGTARAEGKAKYLLIFHTTGTVPDLWRPTGSTGDNLVLSEMLEPLEPLRDSLILVDGLDSVGTADNHAAPGGLCGVGYGSNQKISVDQFISDAVGSDTAFPSLILGSVSTESQSTFYRDNQILSPLFLPSTAYETVFDGVSVGGGGDDAALALRLARRQSVLDLVTDQISTLSSELGSAERQKLELHTESIRELEDRLVSGGAAEGCDPGPAAVDSPELLTNSALHADLAVSAFACGLTRVAAVEFGHHQATQVSLPEIGNGDWHQFLHSNMLDEVVRLERWVAEQFVATAERLKSLPAPDGGGTLYDQTLMIWTRGMGDAVVHNGADMRFVIAGGAGGYLDHAPGGRYVQGNGEAHQRVLLNLCEAMGVSDFSGFGGDGAEFGAREPLASIGS